MSEPRDLVRISRNTDEMAGLEARVRSFSRTVDERGLAYRLLRRDSISALAGCLRTLGLTSSVARQLGSRRLLRLRLPGIDADATSLC